MGMSADHNNSASAMVRGRRSADATTIADIMHAAKAEFASHGFDRAKVDSICQNAKVSKQLLYYYFGSKAALYSLILDEAAEGTKNLMRTAEYSTLHPEKALVKFIKDLFRDYVDRPQIAQMTIDEALHNFIHVGKASPLAKVLRMVIDDVLGEIVNRGRRDGVFEADVEPEGLFWIIFSLVTTWYAHFPLVAMVSRTRDIVNMDAAVWQNNGIRFVLASVLTDRKGTE